MNSTEPATTSLPSVWPGAFGAYKYSSAAVRRNFWLLVEVFCVLIGLGILSSALSKSGTLMGSVASLAVSVVSLFGSVMMMQIYLASVHGQKLSNDDLFSDRLPMLALKYFGLSLVVGILSIVSLLLFVIPFFFVMPRLSLAPYFLVDKDIDVFEAVSASWNATKGNVGKVYGIVGVTILMCLLVLTVIGIPFALYFVIMYSAAYAVLYQFITNKAPAAPTSPATVTE